MSRFRSKEMQEAYEKGGFRERYAMNHGNRNNCWLGGSNGYRHKGVRFTYSKNDEFQDANGATYDLVDRKWVN